MRIKLLSTIASFFFLSLAITSCLNSDNDFELGSDDTITAFALDTIYGVDYKFTIDQIRGEIYNQDSIAFGADTIIDKILIKTLSYSGWIITGDTLFNQNDSVDFSNTMTGTTPPGEPLEFEVFAPNGETSKKYKIEVRIHLTNPDSLVWGKEENSVWKQEAYSPSFSNGVVSADQKTKTVPLGNNMLIFTANGTDIQVYEGPSKGAWPTNTTDLPANADISSILNFKETLYIVTGDQEVYGSVNGVTWTKVTSDAPVENLLTTFYGKDDNGDLIEMFIAGFIEDGGNEICATATVGADGSLTWTKGQPKPTDFPTENISATKSYKTPTGGQQVLLIGKPADGAEATTPWYSKDGLSWGVMTTIEKYSLPVMNEPSILYYGNTIYAFGDDFSTIYTSLNGIVWEKIKKNFRYPIDQETNVSLFEGRSGYSLTVDKDNYIWMIWGKGTNTADEVWRGKLNRLGFEIQ